MDTEDISKVKALLSKHDYKVSLFVNQANDEVKAVFPANILKFPTKKQMEIIYTLQRKKDRSILTINRTSDTEPTTYHIPTYTASVISLLDIIGVCKTIDYINNFMFLYDKDGNPIENLGDLFELKDSVDKVQSAKLTALTIQASPDFSDDYMHIAKENMIEEGYLLVQKFGRFTNERSGI